MTLRNLTSHTAQFIVRKGEQILARLPGIEPGASLQLPTGVRYEVSATAAWNGSIYRSAPLRAEGAAGFLAQILQSRAQGTYVFEVIELASTNPGQLQFQSTANTNVTFTVSKDGRPIQNIVVADPFHMQVMDIEGTFAIHAVIDGITTETAITDNPSAVVTAIVDDRELEPGYFTLEVT